MTSDTQSTAPAGPTSATPEEAYVWVWLGGATTPVVAGKLERDGGQLIFNYGRSYLQRGGQAIALYLPELPLRRGFIPPLPGLNIAGCIRDAAPDAWGRRVILNRLYGAQGANADTGRLDELSYLLQSGSDRIGALDFQSDPSRYVPRMAQAASLEELLTAAARVDAGIPLTPELDQALFHGSSLGGARPKAMIETADAHKWIAKFSSASDHYNVVKAEFVAMRLAARVGLEVAPVRLERAAGKDVLLVRRFDRESSGEGYRRKLMVSALTLLELDEMSARYASYQSLSEIIRHRFAEPRSTLRELYGRLVFNILCGNTDDHARNHAAFWDGESLRLTPAYDICPQARGDDEASQAMSIKDELRASNLNLCLEAAEQFGLIREEAVTLILGQITTLRDTLAEVMDEADLSVVDRNMLSSRQFFNRSIFYGAPEAFQAALR